VKRMSRRITVAALAVGTLLVTGCATITGSETQAILIATSDDSGESVAGADCRLSNNNGAWTVKSPGAANVRKSSDDLLVRCEAEERPPGTARVVSRMNAGMVGNVIFGGAVGVIIDHTRGTAYDYPKQVRVVFGRDRVVENDDVVTSSAVVPAVATPGPRARRPTTLQDLDGLLKER
jgi:hypothetical protein